MTTRSLIPFPRVASLGAALVLASLAVPAVAAAQQPLSPIEIAEARVENENARADALDEHARTLYSTPRKFREAAELHQRAAMIRGDHPTAVESYRSAAWAFSAASSHGLATQMMEKAAAIAAMTGRIEDAANSYIDAALLAVENDRADKVPTMLARVHTVLNAPIVPAETRTKILDRIRADARVAHLDTQRRAAP